MANFASSDQSILVIIAYGKRSPSQIIAKSAASEIRIDSSQVTRKIGAVTHVSLLRVRPQKSA
ncbi:hypothetical protein H6G72_12675 [Planktothricoides sp. FACHB-1370]|uniref:Uncharacterized protein n=1 Tax=Planktothricoides raciborskii FACHB-1370 TaxID=2949576 RepID=A0ABR8EDL7_9CYAN|nr:hypothetical protein [Planktothricoides raciborskii FACHB-1370]MBD2580759.1 hypothetical protein [Planktothricoides raciborskii FACHB-1261]